MKVKKKGIQMVLDNPQEYGLQKHIEWGEEDEKMRNNLIRLLIRLSANTRTSSTFPNYSYPREIEWLKSIKPQNKWKPSDEQIDALETATSSLTVLESLYKELKKL